jgi:hypothetical protein
LDGWGIYATLMNYREQKVTIHVPKWAKIHNGKILRRGLWNGLSPRFKCVIVAVGIIQFRYSGRMRTWSRRIISILTNFALHSIESRVNLTCERRNSRTRAF